MSRPTRTLGIWAPKENIEAARKLAEETRIQREVKRGISRAQRERQEAKYRERFAEAVYEYLSFAPKYDEQLLEFGFDLEPGDLGDASRTNREIVS